MKPRKPKVGFVVATSHNDYVDEAGNYFPVMGMAELAARRLEEKGCELVMFRNMRIVDGEVSDYQVPNYNREACVDSRPKVLEMERQFRREELDCVVIFASSFLWGNLYMQSLNNLALPVIGWAGNLRRGCEAIGLWALRGALDAIGTFTHREFYGLPEDDELIRDILAYIQACRVKKQLSHSLFGLFGAMPMGMLAGAHDDVLWLRKFGVTVEQRESLELRQIGEKFSEDEIKPVYERIIELTGADYPLNQAMERNCRLYLAHRKMIDELGLDFSGLKCTFELSDSYVSACMAQSLLLADGYVSSCTSEPMGALTMYIMKLFSDAPIYQGDAEQVRPDGNLLMSACGAMDFQMVNKAPDCLRDAPALEGDAPSIWVHNTGKEGRVTIGRLSRIGDDYALQLSTGTVLPSDDFEGVTRLGFPSGSSVNIKLDGDPVKYHENLRSQYTHITYGDIGAELKCLCELLGVEVIEC